MATREVWANPTTKGDTMFETAEQERARAQREIKTLKQASYVVLSRARPATRPLGSAT